MNTNNLTIPRGHLVAVDSLPHFEVSWSRALDANIRKDILHIYYPVNMIQDEVEKRSSYLGKFRQTEQAQHLLDLLAMTRDETDLFYPFMREAMACIFDVLANRIKDYRITYKFDESDLVDMDADPEAEYHEGEWVKYDNMYFIALADGQGWDADKLDLQCADYRKAVHFIMEYPSTYKKTMIEPIDIAIGEALVNRILYQWLLLAYPQEAETYLLLYNEAIDKLNDRLYDSESSISPIIPRMYC